MAIITAERYHDISVGHRVYGHESKCRHLHGHNYRVHFTIVAPELDAQGRVLDFGVMKSHLCMWLEEHWDHKFLLWEKDPMLQFLLAAAEPGLVHADQDHEGMLVESLVPVPFNPTAENMAKFLLEKVGPAQLTGTGAALIRVRVEETRKCSAVAEMPQYGACMHRPADRNQLAMDWEERA